jgi:hypothetical protein
MRGGATERPHALLIHGNKKAVSPRRIRLYVLSYVFVATTDCRERKVKLIQTINLPPFVAYLPHPVSLSGLSWPAAGV